MAGISPANPSGNVDKFICPALQPNCTVLKPLCATMQSDLWPADTATRSGQFPEAIDDFGLRYKWDSNGTDLDVRGYCFTFVAKATAAEATMFTGTLADPILFTPTKQETNAEGDIFFSFVASEAALAAMGDLYVDVYSFLPHGDSGAKAFTFSDPAICAEDVPCTCDSLEYRFCLPLSRANATALCDLRARWQLPASGSRATAPGGPTDCGCPLNLKPCEALDNLCVADEYPAPSPHPRVLGCCRGAHVRSAASLLPR